MEQASSRYVAGQAGASDAWAEEAATSGHRGGQRIAGAGWRPASKEVAAALGVRFGEPVACRRRIVLLDDRPIEIADAYYPASVATGPGAVLAEPAKIKGGTAALLASLGHTADQVRETVSAHIANADERELLGLDGGQPVLVLQRITIDEAGTPIEYAVMVMTAEGRTLNYTSRSE